MPLSVGYLRFIPEIMTWQKVVFSQWKTSSTKSLWQTVRDKMLQGNSIFLVQFTQTMRNSPGSEWWRQKTHACMQHLWLKLLSWSGLKKAGYVTPPRANPWWGKVCSSFLEQFKYSVIRKAVQFIALQSRNKYTYVNYMFVCMKTKKKLVIIMMHS